MSIHNGAKTVQNGLIFHYDMHDRKSWKGKPTSNYCYQRNPKYLNTSNNYTKHSYSTDTTFDKNHPGRISVPDAAGGTLSTMVNTGVNSGVWNTTHHAYFAYDTELKRPVAIMNDADGQWKAHSFGTGYTLNNLGWSEGTEYSISWLSWTTRIDKAANAGVYYRRSSDNVTGFHAGQSNSQSTAKNTKPFTWQRVYANFTVPAGMDPSYTLSIYCYGHHTGRGIVKMADIQWEQGEASHFVEENNVTKPTRSSTQALLDLSGGNTMTLNNMNYSSDGTFSFNGSSSYINMADNSAFNNQSYTMECWIKTNALSQNGFWFEKGTVNTQYSFFQEGSNIVHRTNVGSYSSLYASSSTYLSTTEWKHCVATFTSGDRRIYINGVLAASDTLSGTVSTNNGGQFIGRYGGSGYYYNGSIGGVKVYNRALSADEVKSNFQALRGRYGV